MNSDIEKQYKLLAIVSYLTPIGLIIAITMNLEKRNPFVFFHARQMIGLVILSAFTNIVDKYVNEWLGLALWFIVFAFWLIGLIAAIQGQYKAVPLVGKHFQDWFRTLK